ncbi:precorrin-4 C(11)-methyltransferase [Williamsia deligens]|uniref:Precorrin-4 C(11)-methyltransferase n=1 Tax=Williamsia deligens TaxID=321325 RepID=A0ABW3GAG3_9NOCA|nr:precorrin-4 C(11)-methyltransferase [Williamsia deligens]MCP2195195.1 precorrin-4/cobalt-precorrin-4 C11-methyltransferase [Williamsia deligens]
MTVHFIGAGPGAPDLLTLRAVDTLGRCHVCLYAGSLVPQEVLSHCPDDAELIDTARMPLDEIVGHIRRAHDAGHDVARLHSGDTSLYSAMAEQIRALDAIGIDHVVVPGVPAFAAVAATLGRELTVPGIGQSLLITRVSTLSTDMPPGETLSELARTGVTLSLHLAAHRVDAVAADLTPHYGADCPCAVVAFASRDDEIIVRCTLADLADRTHAAGIVRTAIIVVGRVLGATGFPDSYLYSAARMTKLSGPT